MAADLGEMLGQKYGPLPGWAWAGVAAVGAVFVLPRLSGGKPGPTAGATSPAGQATTDYSLGYTQGLQSAGVRATTSRLASTPIAPAPTPPAEPVRLVAPIWQFGAPPQDKAIVWQATPGGQSYFQQVSGGMWPGGVRPGIPDADTQRYLGQFGWQWAIVPEGTDAATYARAVDAGAVGGIGGPGAIGSRSAELMSPWHPLLKQRTLYPHYVRAVGGAPNHAREVHRVSQQAGVHPARLWALNAHPTGWIRIA